VTPPHRWRASISPRGALLELLKTAVLGLVVFALLQTFVGRSYAVEQTSMETTLEPGQHVFVDELSPHFTGYAPGDIVVFAAPPSLDLGLPLIKRVIAVGGQTVVLRGGSVYVDGRRLEEPYLYGDQPTEPTGGARSWRVPAGDLFVMGDHRVVSVDSRTFGPIPVSSVIGRAWLRVLPLDRFGFLPGAP
jgi:signal peptidase I